MSRRCPNCGTACAPEARFCRLCGTPLRAPGSPDAPVSPSAKTAPLSDEGRTTHGFPSEDGSASAPETARVKRAEMESILRRSAPTPSSLPETKNSQPFADDESTPAPVTTALASGTGKERAEDSVKSVEAKGAQEEKASVNGSAAGSGSAASSVPKQRSSRPRRFFLAGVGLVVLAVGAGTLALYYSRRAATTDEDGSAASGSNEDRRRSVEDRLSEAEKLLAEGKTTDAIARLRSALRLEPTNPRAHRLLAEALERTGAVNEAIDEYRAAVQYDPNNEETQLRYADALRRVGRTEEAREIYQKLSASSSEDVSRTAKEQLASIGTEPTQPVVNDAEGEARTPTRTEETGANNALPSSNSTRTSVAPPTTNNNGTGAARSKNDPVASYNTAMKIIEGKDIRKMNRAELIRAYELFQYAQTGPNSADANRHLRELDKELFERRKRKQ
ncbi:MAG: tetratricopeptide repeat protein [Pyrinomonadaceae bacterium]|nr:tetratricopeptide repeat protein [Pyrinomonadaceae bacterium]